MTKRGLSGKLPLVNSMGISIWDPVWAQKEHRGKRNELVHIIKGKVALHMGGKVFRAEAGDILVVPAGVAHRDEFVAGEIFEALLIQFDWQDLAIVYPKTVNNSLIKLPKADKGRARELVMELYREFKEGRNLGRELVDAALYHLLILLVVAVRDLDTAPGDKDGSRQKERQRRIIDQAKEYIGQHLENPIALTDIADYLKMSSYHLSHLFSRESGFTFSEYLINRRMEKAAQLLADPASRVADAAYACGFEDPNYFGKVFRKHFGVSPGVFRAGKSK